MYGCLLHQNGTHATFHLHVGSCGLGIEDWGLMRQASLSPTSCHTKLYLWWADGDIRRKANILQTHPGQLSNIHILQNLFTWKWKGTGLTWKWKGSGHNQLKSCWNPVYPPPTTLPPLRTSFYFKTDVFSNQSHWSNQFLRHFWFGFGLKPVNGFQTNEICCECQKLQFPVQCLWEELFVNF